MKKFHTFSKPTHSSDITFSDFYDDISRDWQQKAQQLQIKRWRQLKRLTRIGVKY